MNKIDITKMIIAIVLALIITIAIVEFFTWIICFGFGFTFNFKIGLGVWGVCNLISSLIRCSFADKKFIKLDIKR